MVRLFAPVCVAWAFLLQNVGAQSSPAIFGQAGAASAVSPNVAQYLLDLDAQGAYLHYYGDQQIFLLALSPKLRERLQTAASGSGESAMPATYGVEHLSDGICNWADVPGWSSANSGADARTVFYGRELRQAPNTLFGNAIHLSLGPEEDSEGWTPEEMSENFRFWQAMHQEGRSVAEADQVRQFRQDVGSQLGGTFMQRWGPQIATKAHRFALQMYTIDSQNDASNPSALFFEMFPARQPPTAQVVFFEAEDGCKGTPTPTSTGASMLFEVAPGAGVATMHAQPLALSATLLGLAVVLLTYRLKRQSLGGSPALVSSLDCSREDVE